MKVLIPQEIAECGKKYLEERGYEVVTDEVFDPEALKREGADADGMICRTAPYTADIMHACKKCKIYARHGVGIDNMDLKTAEEMGAYVTATKYVNHIAVAEHAVALMLSLAKSVELLDRKQREDPENAFALRNAMATMELHGKTAAIIGLGAIGLETARQLRFGFCMDIIGYDAYADPDALPDYIRPASLEECLREGDVVSIHVPAKPETMNLIDRRALELMKPTAILVNTARGGIVNEDDLYEALKAGRIFGAGLDVFVHEPPEKGNRFFELDNFVGSPHIAGMSREACDGMSLGAAMAVDDVLSGRTPQYPVNSPKL